MSDIHALSGAYAVDALDDDERAEFEKHLAVCPECRAEVRVVPRDRGPDGRDPGRDASAERCATPCCRASARSARCRPRPPDADRRPAAGHRCTRPAPADCPAPGRGLGRRDPPGRRRPGLAAREPSRAHLADQILHAPDAVSVTEPVPGGGQLTLVRSASLEAGGDGRQDVPAPSRTTYQMWLQQPGQGMVSAGLMPDAASRPCSPATPRPPRPPRCRVEPETGSPHPTSDPIAALPVAPPPGRGDRST